ncbi:3-isopropylmalate dehydrogenase [Cellulophaga baltica]|uniref:3-isopropylmalate dehydrogenase n=1 Tax=Cellulophaga TaxID=104264 RepID=UPI001C06E375|nr:MULTISPECIES: 3-isopropylmalate dehydrogenase [Cellulophaga]MBU2996086.1 3-isopropylmalate dehydrogenase [Cellulophaga baltica]MDO6767481.1 3-isopropylmalate dehydrogenase [Cellulophaga sp. 1_MG-2023]
MNIKIALLPGDGIGPEVVAQAVKCLQAVEETFAHQFTYTTELIGATAIYQSGVALPKETIELCNNSDAVIFGAIGLPEFDDNPDAKIRPEDALFQLRKELGVFANIRPVAVFPTLLDKSPLKESVLRGTDFVIYRELTGGVYNGEHTLVEDGSEASDIATYSESQITRVAHLAFKAAKKRRKKVTLVDKSNVLETSRLWRRVVKRISESYPDVELECIYLHNSIMQMILKPSRFDVILAPNLFGDIISDEASVIGGSIGLLPSASIGDGIAMFEPIHGSYPQAQGKDIANPIATILSAAMLLQHFGLEEESRAVVSAVNKSLKSNIVTPDINPKSKYGTNDVGDFIASNIVDTDESLNMNYENIGLGKSTII